MRLIAKFENKEKARRFLAYLMQENCNGLIEHDREEYAVWIYDEDLVEKAFELYQKFSHPEFNEEIKEDVAQKETEKGPLPISEDPIFLAQVKEIKRKIGAKALYQKLHANLTKFFIITCSFLLMVNIFFHVQTMKNGKIQTYYTPVDRALCFDEPVAESANLQKTWMGIYPILENWEQNKGQLSAPKFQKILSGEYYRLFTPCLLHAGLIHLLFNMLWLLVLGKQIEERLFSFRYLVLIVIVGAFSNLCQYLISGPNFVGFSGVICGMAGFIWVRQKVAPWEGYPIPKTSLKFLFIFIFGIALVQLITFLLSYFRFVNLPINIANGAHISGLLMGMLLARLHYFDRQRR